MIDRLDDLRSAAAAAARGRSRRSSGAASPRLLRSPEASPPPTPQIQPYSVSSSSSLLRRADAGDPLQAFLAKLESVRLGPLQELEGSLAEAQTLHLAALSATTAKGEKDALLKAEACAERASAAASRTCSELKSMAPEPGATGSEAALRRQAFAGVSVLFQNALNSYFQAQMRFRQEMEDKVSRQLRAAFPEADDTVVEAVAAGRASAASTIQDAILRQSGTAPLTTASALQATREKCDELANLARAARDLSQVFVDVESLVNSQGEILNDIGSHVASTREQVKRGHEVLLQASRARSACRWRWTALILILIVICLVLFIVFSMVKEILSLKGNVRVFCRWRPALSGQEEASETVPVEFREDLQGITVYGTPQLNVTGLSEQTRKALRAADGSGTMRLSLAAPRLSKEQLAELEKAKAKRELDEIFERSIHVTSLKDEDFANVLGPGWKQQHPTKIDFSSDRYQLDTLEGPNLAYNLLKNMPSLGLLPSLEVLILSHNQLSGSLENLKSSMRIKRLDLAYNEFDPQDWTPSQLSQALNAMSHLRSLQNLRLYHNKFVACFKEYQIYVVSKLKSLQKLDDCIITMDMRDEIESTNLLALDVYDVAFKKRQEELARKQSNAGMGSSSELGCAAPHANGETRVGKLKLIMESLEEILEEPSALAARIGIVRENAALRAQSSGAEGFDVEEVFWDGMMDHGSSDKETRVSSRSPSDDWVRKQMPGGLVVGLPEEMQITVMERHDTARNNLVDTLGFLSCIVSYDLGNRCLDLLRRMMLSSDHCREEAGRGVKTIVVPTLLAFGEADINSEITKTMLLGLLDLVQEKQIREEVCDILEELLPLLLNWFLQEEYLTEDGAHIAPWLRFLSMRDVMIEYAREVKLLASITVPEEYATRAATPELAARTIMHLENKDNMRLRSTWIDVLQISQNIIMYGSQEIVDMFYKAASHSKVVARLRQDRLYLSLRLRDDATKQCFSARAVTKTLRTMLEDPKVYKKQALGLGAPSWPMNSVAAIRVVEDLRKVTPLLQFLGGKKYPDLYRMALKYSEDQSGDAPPFAELENESIEDDQARQLVNDAMNTQGSLGLVRFSGSQIEPDEMGAIVKCLSDVKNIGEGRTEEMLALVVRQLERLLLAPGDTGLDFRQGFAERAVAECSEILMANSARSTDRESDELEKLALSCAIVNFYFRCSAISSLRSCLRNPTIDAMFPRIMKFEEELHSPLAADVRLEQTWLGRSLENLLQCFQGGKVLVRGKKVTIRILAQMADVIEGRSSYEERSRRRRMRTLKEVAAAEAKMWDVQGVQKAQRFLDNQEFEDRIAQAQQFVSAGGPARLQDFLLDLAAKEREEYYIDQYLKAGDKPGAILIEAEAKKAAMLEKMGEELHRDEALEVDMPLGANMAVAPLGLSWTLSDGIRPGKDQATAQLASSVATEESVTVVGVTGLPAWLEDTSLESYLAERVQGNLQNFGLIQGRVAVQFQATEPDVDSPSESYDEMPHQGVRFSMQLDSGSQWPVVRSINVDCRIQEAGSFINLGVSTVSTSTSTTVSDWAEDVWSARRHWEQRLLSGLSAYIRRREREETSTSVDSPLSSSVWNFTSENYNPKRQTIRDTEESVWRLYGPKALGQLLSELILNCAVKIAARFLEGTMLDVLTTLPCWPVGPLNFEEHFPPLSKQDMYVDSDKQFCPDLFLRLAAVVWKAASQGMQTLELALWELRQRGMPLVKLALHTPVLYKSGGRHRSLSGPLLMFVVDQMNKKEFATDLVHSLIASSADPNAEYVLFPTGKQRAIGRFPLLCLAGNRRAHNLAEALLRHGADVNWEITLNYFPHGGHALWSAVWGSDYGMIRLLLSFGEADVNVRAWHPDAPPLTGQARHLPLLSLASTALDSEHVHLLLECKADIQEELSPTFAACHAEVTRLLASHVAYSHPQAIVHRCDELQGTCGVWIDWVFQEISGDITSKRLFRSALSAASDDLDLHRSFMAFLCDLIQRLPTAAAELLDKICLQSPHVQEPGRHPLRTRCLFQAHELHTAYVAETKWAPDGTKFQNALAPPARQAGERYCGLFPTMRQVEFCDIQLVGIPGLVDERVLLSLQTLEWETLVKMLTGSIVFQALVEHMWKAGMRKTHYMQASTSVIQFCCLLIWWQRTETGVMASCWAVFAGSVGFQLSNILLLIHARKVPLLRRVIHAGMGVHLVASGWLAWDETPRDDYKSSMAVNVVAVVVSIVYNCRVLQPFGIRVGQSILPILNSVGRREFAAMAMLMFVTLFATLLYVCIEFDTDAAGFASAAFQTWQTLIVGEPTLVDASDSNTNVIRYLAVSLCFFACNTVLMNILINVTGSVYLQETANAVGSLQAERLRICVEAVAGAHFTRCAVFIECLAGWGLWLILILAASNIWNALNILIAMACWLVGFCLQWHVARRAAAAMDNFEASSHALEPGALRYLWICRPTDHAEVHASSRHRSSRSPRAGERSPMAQVQALKSRFDRQPHIQFMADDMKSTVSL
ncbi:SYP124 [Symbiodinium microadriaticum]|nr:SYP124 [Symbiodinium microadriaticum]